MKPVIIIAIAVVCSVVAVLGVLIGLQQISDYQAQVAYDEYQTKEKARQEVEYAKNKEKCVTLFYSQVSWPYETEITPYQYCLENDYLSAMDFVINRCISDGGGDDIAKVICTEEWIKVFANKLKGN